MICSVCKIEKSTTDFSWYNKAQNKLQNYCKSCRKVIDSNYWKNNKERISSLKNKRGRDRYKKVLDYIQVIKNVPCKDCGVKYNPWVMDFDHLENKDFDISNGIRKNFDLLIQEIAKCEVICANCHRERTYKRKNLTKDNSCTIY